MTNDEGSKKFNSVPLNTNFLADAPKEAVDIGEEILARFNEAVLYLVNLSEHFPDEADFDKTQPVPLIEAAVAFGLGETAQEAILRIAQIESAKHGTLGIDPDLVMVLAKHLLGAYLIAGVRYGQAHPNAFLGAGEQELASIQSELERLVNDQPEEGN